MEAERARREHLIAEIRWLNEQSDKLEDELAAADKASGSKRRSGANDGGGISEVMKLLLNSDGAGPAAPDAASASSANAAAADAADDDVLPDDVVAAHLHQLASITGIVFDRVDHSLVEASGKGKGKASSGGQRRRFHLTGAVLSVSFQVSFDVVEETRVIERMEVAVSPQCADAFEELRQWTEATRSPLVFFQALVQYAEANRQRANALRELAERFPGVVSLPLGADHGWFARFEGQRVGFNATWKIAVSREGRVSSTLSLVPSTPPGKGASAQHSRLLQDAPAQFGGLVRVLGAAGALTAVAELLAQ